MELETEELHALIHTAKPSNQPEFIYKFGMLRYLDRERQIEHV